MIAYHTKKDLKDIQNAINAYEVRSNKMITKNLKDDSVINLASGIVVIDDVVQSISVNLKLYDLTIVKEVACEQYHKCEIIIFEKVSQLIMFLCKSCKSQLLGSVDLRFDKYA